MRNGNTQHIPQQIFFGTMNTSLMKRRKVEKKDFHFSAPWAELICLQSHKKLLIFFYVSFVGIKTEGN